MFRVSILDPTKCPPPQNVEMQLKESQSRNWLGKLTRKTSKNGCIVDVMFMHEAIWIMRGMCLFNLSAGTN